MQKNTFHSFDPVLRVQTSQNLFWILRPFCLFRTYYSFRHGAKGYKYNAGHSCTYKQILFGRMKQPFIEMIAEKQYTFLVDQLENDLLRKSTTAIIYRRILSPEYVSEMCDLLAHSHQKHALEKIIQLDKDAGFDIICRHYYNGQEKELQDPVLTEEDNIKLWYQVKEARLLLSPTALEETTHINFKSEVQNALQ